MKKIRLAVIGAGSIAQLAHIPNWKKIPGVELMALCDVNRTRARAVAEKFEIPHVYTDDAEVLSREDVDAVDICAPTNFHNPLALAALASGKHVLVEKPMSRTAEEAEQMVRAARNVRFWRDVVNLRQFIENGELGQVFYAKCGWLRRQDSWTERPWLFQKKYSGGGVLMDLGIQILDMTLWLFGNKKVKSVKAATYKQVAKQEVEDAAISFIHLEDNSTFTLEVSWTFMSPQDTLYLQIFGTQGGAILNPLRVVKEMHGNLVNMTPQLDDTPTYRYKLSYKDELGHFIKCLRDDTPMLSSGEESLQRMRVIEAMYESAQLGKEVKL
jgi:predicted dehydrogenase